MGTCTCTAGHHSGYGVALDIGKLAQVAERLGISLTDDVGLAVAVEDVGKLEGIAVGSAIGGCGVIAYQIADFVLEVLELFGSAGWSLICYVFGIFYSLVCRADFGEVGCIFIRPTVA